MSIRKNARLTPLGLERIVRSVLSGQTPDAAVRAAGLWDGAARQAESSGAGRRVKARARGRTPAANNAGDAPLATQPARASDWATALRSWTARRWPIALSRSAFCFSSAVICAAISAGGSVSAMSRSAAPFFWNRR